ncbi:hypothetical protein [Streptoalloteichus hindustanus]|uniref:Aldo/keto reductase family protein n=1 Tax=Streptoalloteichus hindustanus TaxID=2017 RepID=A0A1M5LWP7_STRHI|nr:hypothetical protein [Streptoalloteichus hindustanus]SHG69524.1 hypothetical protein SAMN05444320_11290 [Streptoalloteichus hindustanus]
MPIIPAVTPNNGVRMPRLGLDVFRLPEADDTPVRAALEAGYRAFGTATIAAFRATPPRGA